MRSFEFCLLVLCGMVAVARSAKILCAFPFPSISHQSVFRPIWRELHRRGHELTVLTTDPWDDPSVANVTQINMSASYAHINAFLDTLNEPIGALEQITRSIDFLYAMSVDQFRMPEVQRLYHNCTFDLVIAEMNMVHYSAFSHKYDCPLVGVKTSGALVMTHDELGNPSHPVYNPEQVLPFGDKLNLMERMISVAYSAFARTLPFLCGSRLNEILREHLDDRLPSNFNVGARIDLLLVNVNHVFYRVRPNVPAVVELGGVGMHVQEAKALPEDLQRYLDRSRNGVIYFSLGSNIRSSVMTPEKLELIKGALADLPYDFVWKWESEELPGKPGNVMVSKWLPQQDLLRHPNVKLFITQGGLQSLEEAVYFKVPCLGIPFYAEQHSNLRRAESHGFAKILAFKDLTKESLKAAVMEMTQEKKYKEAIAKVSDLVQDQPMKAVDKAVWWIEYVLRHKGAAHLRSPAIGIPWYQYFLLDVLGVLAFVIFVIVFVIAQLTSAIRKCIFKRKIKKE